MSVQRGSRNNWSKGTLSRGRSKHRSPGAGMWGASGTERELHVYSTVGKSKGFGGQGAQETEHVGLLSQEKNLDFMLNALYELSSLLFKNKRVTI